MKKIILDFLYWLLMERKGWKLENKLDTSIKRYVLLSIPHTSNWDAIHGILFFHKIKLPVKFAIKIEWMKFPFKGIFESVGAMGIDRSAGKSGKKSAVEAMVDLFKEHNDLIICVTPEGTRKPVKKWKTGFYHVAVGAKVPIAIGILDYKNKVGLIEKFVYPSGDMEKDMREILSYYNKSQAKFPDNFELDERYR